MLDTPVAFFVWNRPQVTARVFARIRFLRPRTLLLVADGPREGHPTDVERCALTRELVGAVDWPCDVEQSFAERNLGCQRRVAGGLHWVFERHDRAIIMEDDCLPSMSSFRFFEELLERYDGDERVMSVLGSNYSSELAPMRTSYGFSRLFIPWGWATWRRAWKHYSPELPGWSSLRESDWLERHHGPAGGAFWRGALDQAASGAIDTWDYRWIYSVWRRDGVVVLPGENLVQNLGWGADATHTFDPGTFRGRLQGREMGFPLRHPERISVDENRERLLFARSILGLEKPAPTRWNLRGSRPLRIVALGLRHACETHPARRLRHRLGPMKWKATRFLAHCNRRLAALVHGLPSVHPLQLTPNLRPLVPAYLDGICLPPHMQNGPRDHDDYSPLMAIAEALQVETVLELGTAYGNTTANLCRLFPRSRVVTVNAPSETMSGALTTYALTTQAIGRVYRESGQTERVEQVFENTLDLQLDKHLPAASVDLAIIDACHDMEYVLNDFGKVKSFIRPGGVVLFHDTHPSLKEHLYGSYMACMRLRGEGHDIRHLAGTWWAAWVNGPWEQPLKPTAKAPS